MRFGSTPVPGTLFALARTLMLEQPSFTPSAMRAALMEKGREDMLALSDLPGNYPIIAERVMREVISEMVTAGQLTQIKRGLWARK
jgi:hypothetical protein